MDITLPDGSKLSVVPLTAEPTVEPIYDIVPLSNGNVRTVDRGANDIISKMHFSGDYDKATEVYRALFELRRSELAVLLSSFDDSYFGDNIDHSVDIETVVESIEPLESPKFNTFAFKATFRASNVSYTTTGSLPDLTCAEVGQQAVQKWNTGINILNDDSVFFSDKGQDMAEFKASYILSKDATAELLSYWMVTMRGGQFEVDDADFGVRSMFGPNYEGPHNVVIKSIGVQSMSPVFRHVTVELMRNGVFVEPVPPVTVNYFEAGTVAHPFSGAVGAPVTSDPNWIKANNGEWSFDGESATVGTHTALAYQLPVYKGLIDKCYSDTTIVSDTSQSPVFFDEPMSDGTGDNRIAIVVHGASFDRIVKIQTVVGGVVTNNVQVGAVGVAQKPDRCVSEWTIEGDKVTVSAVITINGTDYPVSGSVTNGYNTAVDYGATMFSYYDSQKWDFIRVEGTGFPYNE